jgi:hypothetical protein
VHDTNHDHGGVTDTDVNTGRANASGEVTIDLFGHAHRRLLLSILLDPSPPRRAGPIARELAARTGCWAGSPEVRDARLALHHVHLPKLDEAGLVEYDPETRQVIAIDRDRIRSVVADLGVELTVEGA